VHGENGKGKGAERGGMGRCKGRMVGENERKRKKWGRGWLGGGGGGREGGGGHCKM
jgi:hypothetical protein